MPFFIILFLGLTVPLSRTYIYSTNAKDVGTVPVAYPTVPAFALPISKG